MKKTIIDKHQRLSFVLRGSNRCKIYNLLLSISCTPSEISKETNIRITNVTRVIKQMKEENLIKNLTPEERTGSLYSLTSLALEFQSEFKAHMKFREKKR